MQRRFSILVAGLLAVGTVLGTASAASAIPREHFNPLGATFTSNEQVGHSATNAQFRLVKATNFLRNPTQYAALIPQINYSVQLRSSGRVVQLFIGASTGSTTYAAVARVYNASTHALMSNTLLGLYLAGDTVQESLSYDPSTGFVTFATTSISPGIPVSFTTQVFVGSQSFGDARVGTEFGPDPWTAPVPSNCPLTATNAGGYSGVVLTTYSGSSAGFYSWWAHHRIDMTASVPGGASASPGTLNSTGTAFTNSLHC